MFKNPREVDREARAQTLSAETQRQRAIVECLVKLGQDAVDETLVLKNLLGALPALELRCSQVRDAMHGA